MNYDHHPDDHAAFCEVCDVPLLVGPLCYDCANPSDDVEEDEWGGMTDEERVEFCALNIENGNLTDAINFMMHDGDVRADSVKLALRVSAYLCLHQYRSVETVNNQLIRFIDTWERE